MASRSCIERRIQELTDRIKVAASEHEILRLRSEQDKLLDRLSQPSVTSSAGRL